MSSEKLKKICPRCGKNDEPLFKCLYCGQEWAEGPDIPTKPAPVEPCDKCQPRLAKEKTIYPQDCIK